MSTGDAKGLEGTDGYIFPRMVIGNGVFMVLCTYAHSGLLNILASLFGQGVQEDHLNQQLKLLVQQIGEQNLPYLRTLGLDMVCECFDHFFAAWNQAETISGVQSLVSSISLFGALMHGWLVYLFPYRLGVELRRASPKVPKVTNVPNVCDFFKIEPYQTSRTFSVPLRYREGKGLGVATWDVSSPNERAKLNANTHLPETLPSHASNALPLIVRLQPCASSSIQSLAAMTREVIEERLSETGAILFRNFPLSTFQDASELLTALNYTLYPDPSGRELVAEGLYHASLGVPKDWNIGQHQEHIFSKEPPSKLFLYCQTPSPEGGETPLAHAGKVWELLSKKTRDQLRARGVRSEMLRGNNASENPIPYRRSWQGHFLTGDLETAVRKVSEQFDGELTVDKYKNIIVTSPKSQAFKVVEGREIYYSQLQNIYSLKWMWGDADEYISDEILEDVMSAIWNAATVFKWEAGDFLVVDNTLALHGRLSYQGDRQMGAGLTRDWSKESPKFAVDILILSGTP